MAKLMNKYALNGHKVKVTSSTSFNGTDHDRNLVTKHLKIGVTYVVRKTIVNGWNTQVYLHEFPDVCFNAVNFVDVIPQPSMMDKQHPDWKKFNK